MHIDDHARVEHYLDEVTARVRATFGTNLLGVYTTGSLALGGYRAGRSDIDMMAVLHEPTRPRCYAAVAELLSDRVLPCPAAGLEFVLYPRDLVGRPTAAAGYLLNFNTGSELPSVCSLNSRASEGFWYAIDRAITAQSGHALYGPPASSVFAEPDRQLLLPLLIESVDAQASAGGHLLDNAVLNACRSLCYAREGRWYTKLASGRRIAAGGGDYAPIVRKAMATFMQGRAAGRTLPREPALAFLAHAGQTLRHAAAESHRVSLLRAM
jgi:hypothetical protein